MKCFLGICILILFITCSVQNEKSRLLIGNWKEERVDREWEFAKKGIVHWDYDTTFNSSFYYTVVEKCPLDCKKYKSKWKIDYYLHLKSVKDSSKTKCYEIIFEENGDISIRYLALERDAYDILKRTPIVGLDPPYNTPSGAYIKDLNNEFNKFEGTWLYTDGNTVLTIVIEKKEMVHDGGEYYEDLLIGEYKYVENGVELVNTLSSLNSNSNNIRGNEIHPNNLYPACDDCSSDERRVMLYFNDPEREYLNSNIILRYDTSQIDQMKVTVYARHGSMRPNIDSPTETRVPYGEYVMVKQ